VTASWSGYLLSQGDTAGAQWWLGWEKGYFSGTNGLGSDADAVSVNGATQSFGKVDGAERVVPDANAQALSLSRPDGAASVHVSTSANETLTGGSGVDVFRFAKLFGHDTVEHFTAGEDLIELDHGAFADVSDVLAHASQVGSDVVIGLDSQDSILLKNVALQSLHASDFHFV
jgi:hypothetical protein